MRDLMPALDRNMHGWFRRPLRLKVAAVAAVLMFTVACATHNIVQAPTGRFQRQQGFDQFSPQQDIQLGQQAEREVSQQMPLLPDSSPVVRYVQQLGQALAAHAPGPNKWPFSFHVVNSKDINAFALPGGPIYINLGTIQAADDEGQLAGVLAHEISHVVLRHSTEQASKAQMAQIPLAILDAVLPGGAGGQLARMGLSFGAQSVFLKYSRTAESEADLLGSQIMYDTGYDPYSMVEFFTKLEKDGGPGAPQFLSDHPNPGNRVANVRKAIEKYPRKTYRQTSLAFEQVKKEVANMHPMSAQQIAQWQRQHGVAQAQGFSSAAVQTDGRFDMLNHSAFQMAYPANWKVYGNPNSAVVIAPPNAIGQNAIAAGVIVGGYAPRDGEPLPQATSDLLHALEQGNPELQVASNGEQVNVNGVAGVAIDLVGPSAIQTPQGPLTEHDKLVTLERPDGSILYMVFIAPQQDYGQLGPVFQQMLDSFRPRA